MEITKQIRHFTLFQGLSEENLSLLVSKALHKKVKQGDLLIGETDQVRAFYVVTAGQLKLYKSSSEGKEQTLSLLRPGDPFGLCTAFATESFPANAMALEESAILIIPGELMENVAKKEPVLLLNIIQILSQRLKDSMTLVESLSLKEIPSRLSAFILHELSRESGENKNRLELTITHRELSKMLGATPEALSRTFKKLSTDKILALEGRVITVLNRKAMETLAEGD